MNPFYKRQDPPISRSHSLYLGQFCFKKEPADKDLCPITVHEIRFSVLVAEIALFHVSNETAHEMRNRSNVSILCIITLKLSLHCYEVKICNVKNFIIMSIMGFLKLTHGKDSKTLTEHIFCRNCPSRQLCCPLKKQRVPPLCRH